MKTETLKKLTTDDTEAADRKLSGTMLQVPIELIVPDPDQPRKEFAPEKLQEMKESILQLGILQPMIVRTAKDWFIDPGIEHGKIKKNVWYVTCRRLLKPDKSYTGEIKLYYSEDEAKAALPQYELVAGERRLRGARLAGLKTVPVILRDLTESQIFAVQMVENLQRENLTALEEAAAFQRKVSNGARPDDIAIELSISRATIFSRLRLAELDENTRKALIQGTINTSVAGLAAMVPEQSRKEFLQDVKGNDYHAPASFRQAQEQAERYVRQLRDAGFDTKTDYAKIAGPGPRTKEIVCATCDACTKRSGNMDGCGLKSPNVCTGPECFNAKTAIATALVLAQAKEKGQTVMEPQKAKAEFSGSSLRNSSSYIDLSERCEDLGWEFKNHWKAALKEKLADVKITIAVDGNGKTHELLETSKAREALKTTAEWKKYSKRNGGGASTARYDKAEKAKEKKRREKMKLYAAVARTATPKILKSVDTTQERWAQAMAVAAYHMASQDRCAEVAKRRGWTESQADARNQFDKVLKKKHTAAEWMELVHELLLCADPFATSPWLALKWHDDYKDAAVMSGAKLEKLEKELARNSKSKKGKK